MTHFYLKWSSHHIFVLFFLSIFWMAFVFNFTLWLLVFLSKLLMQKAMTHLGYKSPIGLILVLLRQISVNSIQQRNHKNSVQWKSGPLEQRNWAKFNGPDLMGFISVSSLTWFSKCSSYNWVSRKKSQQYLCWEKLLCLMTS